MELDIYKPGEDFSLTLNENAKKFFINKMKKISASAIYIDVKKSGCTGYAYVIDAVNENKNKNNIEVTLEGLQFYISEKAAKMISGSKINLTINGLNKTISFDNPNVTASCGCGSSFTVDDVD